MGPKPTDVDSYLAALPDEVRAALVKVRAAMREALPSSVEAIKYGMPAYLVEGRAVASFAGWKTHYALYIVAPALFEAIVQDLRRDASKGIIRFNLDEVVPESVFKRLATWDNTGAAPKVQKKKANTKATKASTKKAKTNAPKKKAKTQTKSKKARKK